MNDKGHSTISPSGLYRVFACPGSVREGKLAPIQKPSIYAERGTIQHDAVVRMWQGRPISRLKLDDAERDNVHDCIDYLNEVIGDNKHDLHLESHGDLSIIGMPEIWGTGDVRLLFPNKPVPELHLIDWKFGSGVPVFVESNPQLLCYLLMALTSDEPNDWPRMFIHLVQPPLNYFGRDEISTEEMLDFVNMITDGVRATKSSDAPLNPGDHCKFCPASMTCRARYNKQLEYAADVFEYIEKKPHTVTNDEHAELYSKLDALVKYMKEEGEHGFNELSAGRGFPGYKLVTGRSVRLWKDPDNAAKWIKNYSSLKNVYHKPKMMSPAQVEKKVRGIKKDTDFLSLIDKPPGKLTMVAESDKRKAVDVNENAKKIFEEN